MKILILISLVGLYSCGGILKEKTGAREPASVQQTVSPEVLEEELYLRILEEKYAKDSLRKAIVRGMLVKLHQKYPALDPLPLKEAQADLRKNPRYLALELTVEHLAHRESFKLGARHSAYHHSL